MKKAKYVIALSVVAMNAVSLSGCKKNNKASFAYSIGVASGANFVQIGGESQYVTYYDNGVNTKNRSYSYESTNPEVATIEADGRIVPKSEGWVNFIATEKKSKMQKALKKDIYVVNAAETASGGFNFSGGTSTEELNRRADILGKLEKYVMDTHLTGITLFDNGGYVKYSNRVRIPTAGEQYVEGYGFGILSEGTLEGTLPGTDGGTSYPTYYHGAIGQDSHKINLYDASGSQVGDLASYITSSYWSTRLTSTKDKYEWYPALAADEVYKPIVANNGSISFATSKTANTEPIPMEADPNHTGLFRKWRVYVKADGFGGATLRYKTNSSALSSYNNRAVTLEDYKFIYQLLLSGSNNIIRGTEMANDTSYGIKGAQRFFNETKGLTDFAEIEAKWNQLVASGNLGLDVGEDVKGQKYIDIELINAIDSFTAMYTLSSNLTSPLPKALFTGGALGSTVAQSIKNYGTFVGGGNNKILDYTLCLGPYTLSLWNKDQEIVFDRNDDWFETPAQGGSRYKIPGVYYRVIDTSTDTEKNWKQLNYGNLDSAGVPQSKIDEVKGDPLVKQTKGDATFKLNVNSCNEEQWEALFGANGSVKKNVPKWDLKPWMSNSNFLDGLFYSIDRLSFATARGVTPSTNYFSDAYQMRNATSGTAYNQYSQHTEAVKGYTDNYGYDYDKAVDCFRIAVNQLARDNKITMGKDQKNPTTIKIHIRWMYQTDPRDYGDEIKKYFETAFNDLSVCGGKVKLEVEQEAVENWEDVYNVWMMQGRFDLGFGAISGNTYNPLNFFEVLKSDNSSSFTLNWGADTSKVDENNPIIYGGKKWSFDALWEAADHGGLIQSGEKIKPVRKCVGLRPTKYSGSGNENNLYNGFKLVLDTDFAEFDQAGSTATFDVSRVDCYIFGSGNITMSEGEGCSAVYDKASKKITVTVSPAKAVEIQNAIKSANNYEAPYAQAWQENPFILDKLGSLFSWELYYTLSINGGSASVNYQPVANA